MTDLRDVQCMTVGKRDMCRDHINLSTDDAYGFVRDLNDTLDVAVAALRVAFKHFVDSDVVQGEELSNGEVKNIFCDMHNLTLPQAEALGIFEEGT